MSHHAKKHSRKPAKKSNKGRVGFGDVEIHFVSEHKDRNSHYRDDKRRAERQATEIGGGDELAERSLARAEERCLCSMCECSKHDHNRVLDDGRHTNCRTASVFPCRRGKCNGKLICELCLEIHDRRHNEADRIRQEKKALDELKAVKQVHDMQQKKEKIEKRRADDKKEIERLERDIKKVQRELKDKKRRGKR